MIIEGRCTVTIRHMAEVGMVPPDVNGAEIGQLMIPIDEGVVRGVEAPSEGMLQDPDTDPAVLNPICL